MRVLNNLNLEITPIVAYGLAFVFLILGGLGLARLSDSVADIGARAQVARIELHDLSQIQGTDVWEARLNLSEQIRAQRATKILTGETGGVMAAVIQQALRQLVADTGLQTPQIQVSPEPEDVDGIDVIQFTFTGFAKDWDTVIEALSVMVSGDTQMFIYEMSYTPPIPSQAGISLFRVVGMVPVKIEPLQVPENTQEVNP
ncbi:MAG: hypothetical protein JKY96_07315 [Phycisphaerales bacterium]|nr:hypothetical protein [Phycisphaerales bacterium]